VEVECGVFWCNICMNDGACPKGGEEAIYACAQHVT
jgi:hypothetical protein